MKKKLINLKNLLKSYKKVVVAFSGGVDSSFLLAVSKEVLKENIIAITAFSSIRKKEGINFAGNLAEIYNVKHLTINTNELEDIKFIKNSLDRCYFCKKNLYFQLIQIAKKYNFSIIIDGSNADDFKEFRPGLKVLSEYKIRTPLAEVNLTKNEITELSKLYQLSSYNIPSDTCLATRIPYFSEITKEKLERIQKSENILTNLGFKITRVRDYEETVRIEILKQDFSKLLNKNISSNIIKNFKILGYIYITFDLEGYRSGSMDECITSGK